ncbi:unnamed protein product [Rotaria socialis]|uniref:MULE transposase domain-containing protein n=1 Tax=Rotaria socialis TaxID=392032 RepID=A0A818TB05_9BILA|nr:unnamed protein product [Rotaria socialis]CAF4685332.1 unnamed protein product [Rotaria socialis]
MDGFAGSSTNNNTRNDVTMNDVDVNTLASAIVMAMRMNDGNQLQPHEHTVKDIASAVIMALNSTAKTTTNTLGTVSHIPLRATSSMALTDDSIIFNSIISPPLSPVLQQSSVQHKMKHTTDNVYIVPLQASQNQVKLFASPKGPNNDSGTPVGALVTSSIPTLEWSFTSKVKDLLIINNHTFKCNKTTKLKCIRVVMKLKIAAIGYKQQSSLSHLRLSLLPPLPSGLQFVVPNNYMVNIDGQRFLLQDLSNQKRFKRLLIFASDRQLDFLFQSEWLFIDGTFKVAPSIFTQLICIVGLFEGQAITLCYALLDGKHTDGYRAIIRTLKDEAKRCGTVLAPHFVMTDFEGGLIKAVAAEFPAATRHVGCYFHHCQCIYRMISSLGLKTAYETLDNVRDLCMKLMAIALMPMDDIEDAFLEVSKEITQVQFTDTRVSNLIHDLMNYYDKEWIPIIGKEMYCVHNLDWRTNNICEGMNSRISHKLTQAHPNIWKVMELLICEEFHTYQIINQVTTGRKRPSRATKEQKRYQQQLNCLYNLYEKHAINLFDMLK